MMGAKEMAAQAYARGIASGKGFLGSRLTAAGGGALDVVKTGVGSIEKERGLLGILSILKNTGKEIWNTLGWSSDRGLLNFKEVTLIPFFGKGTFILNPFEPMRRLAAGAVETAGAFAGTTLDVAVNTVGGLAKATARAALGVVTGDFGHLYSSGEEKTKASNKPASPGHGRGLAPAAAAA